MITWQDQRREHMLNPYTTEEYNDYDYLSFLPKVRVRFIPSGGIIANSYNYVMNSIQANYAKWHPLVAIPPPMLYPMPPPITTDINYNQSHSLGSTFGAVQPDIIR